MSGFIGIMDDTKGVPAGWFDDIRRGSRRHLWRDWKVTSLSLCMSQVSEWEQLFARSILSDSWELPVILKFGCFES